MKIRINIKNNFDSPLLIVEPEGDRREVSDVSLDFVEGTRDLRREPAGEFTIIVDEDGTITVFASNNLAWDCEWEGPL